MIRLELTVVAAVLGGFAVWNCGMFAVILLRAIRRRNEVRLSDTLQPLIREELVACLSGSGDRPKLKEYCHRSRRDVSETLMSFQGTVAGGALDRLCEISIELGLIKDWCAEARSKKTILRRPAFARLAFVCAYEPCRRLAGDLLGAALDDADPEVRFYAWRSLARSGSIAEIERLFNAALAQPLLIRILLTEELRRYAVPLCERAVILALKSEDKERVLACLEMVVAWERFVPVPDLRFLIDGPDRRIRIQALRLAPLVPLEKADLVALDRVLMGDDAEAAAAAAVACGRFQFEQALPGLARCLRSSNAALARAAAGALAQMPPKGWSTLEEMCASSNPVTSGAAAEALDRARRQARLLG
jgi:hypothetical protein